MSGVEAVNIIVEHRLRGFFTRAHPSREGYDSVTRCTCHWVSYEDAVGEMQARKIHAEHLVSVLAASGHTIVQLPDLDDLDCVSATPGSGEVRCYLDDARMTADEARELAGLLLAAAAAAGEKR